MVRRLVLKKEFRYLMKNPSKAASLLLVPGVNKVTKKADDFSEITESSNLSLLGKKSKKKNKDKSKKKKDNKFKPEKKMVHDEKKLMKYYEKNIPVYKPVNFQNLHRNLFVIYDKDGSKIYKCEGKISKKKLNKIASKYPDAYILVSLTDATLLKQVSIKTFKKLIDIKFIKFTRDFELASNDDECYSHNIHWHDVDQICTPIYSINELLYTLITEEAFERANEFYMQSKLYLLAGITRSCTILYNNDKIEKLDYDEFLEKFNIDIDVYDHPFPKAKKSKKKKDKLTKWQKEMKEQSKNGVKSKKKKRK